MHWNIITNDDIQGVIFPLMSSLNISYNEIWKDVQNRFVVSGTKYHYCTDPVLGFQINLYMRNICRFLLFVLRFTWDGNLFSVKTQLIIFSLMQ